ncbi:hypothetical protein ACLB2K_061653 [Fragaria x ananassa]
MLLETAIRRTHRGGKVIGDAAGVRWGGGASSAAADGGEQRDVRTLSQYVLHIRPIYIYRNSQGFASVITNESCLVPVGGSPSVTLTLTLAAGQPFPPMPTPIPLPQWPHPQQQPPQPDQPPPQDPPNGNDELDFGFIDP